MEKIIEIVKFKPSHHIMIDEMMAAIAREFEVNIFSETTDQIPLLPDKYWIALADNKVVATVGLSLKGHYAIIKRMMVSKEFRGQNIGLSTRLMQVVISYCSLHRISDIYLGTMQQFKAAQIFYQKHGFDIVLERQLPDDFLPNPIDSVFFKRCLAD